jgi:hypothetical protein
MNTNTIILLNPNLTLALIMNTNPAHNIYNLALIIRLTLDNSNWKIKKELKEAKF